MAAPQGAVLALDSAQGLWPQDAIEVGKVTGAWGVKGWIRVQPFSSDPQAFFSSKRWFIDRPEAVGPAGASPSLGMPGAGSGLRVPYPALLRVQQAKSHGAAVVAQVQDIAGRDAAEALKGARVFVARSSFPTPDSDEYYWVDLLGLDVVNRQGECLGVVAGLLDTGPHSVLRVQPAGSAPAESVQAVGESPASSPEAERLIPFVKAYVDEVNMAQRRITVDWGLDY